MAETSGIAVLDSEEWQDIDHLLKPLELEDSDTAIVFERSDVLGTVWRGVAARNEGHVSMTVYSNTLTGDTHSYGLVPGTKEVEYIYLPHKKDFMDTLGHIEAVIEMGLTIPVGDDLLPLRGLLQTVRKERAAFAAWELE